MVDILGKEVEPPLVYFFPAMFQRIYKLSFHGVNENSTEANAE